MDHMLNNQPHEFMYAQYVPVEPWMKRGAKVITTHGEGHINYVRKSNGQALNIYVRCYMNQFQYQDYMCAAWAVKPII